MSGVRASMRARDHLRRHSLIAGLLLMFAFTWPIDLANVGVLPWQVPFAVYIMLGWGFIFAALIMTSLTCGRSAVIALLKRYLIWRVSWQWYLLALLLLPAVFSSAIFLNAVWTQTPVDFSTALAYRLFGTTANLPLLILPFFLFETVSNGEEMGWRGYVLPRLQANHSALTASLILGAVWGIWHLPKFVGQGSTVLLGWFMVKILAESVLYTWLYNNTRGSLLLVTIFHAVGNTAGVFLPISTTASGNDLNVLIIAVVLEILLASTVVIAAGPSRLSLRVPKQTWLEPIL